MSASPAASAGKMTMSAEYAKSGRSSCKGCSASIAKGALRLGASALDLRGYDSTKWYHVVCFPASSHPLGPVEKVKGFDSIKDDDREQLRELEKDICSLQNNKRDQTAVSPLEVPSPKKAKAHLSSHETGVEENSSVSVEYAKSARSSCKGCSVSIAKGALRLGVSYRDARGFDSTNWYHVTCFPTSSHPLCPIENVKGFNSIKDDDREELRELEKDNKRDQATIVPLEVPGPKKANALISSPEVEEAEKRDQTVSPLEVPSRKKVKAHRSSPEVAVEDASVSVEYAKSARSSCRGCSMGIAKGSLRFGVPVRDRRGFDSTKWYHVTCFPMLSHPLGPIEKVKGFDSIKDDDHEELRELEKDNERDEAAVGPLEDPRPKKANALISSPKVEMAEKRDQTAVSPLEVPSPKKAKDHKSSPEVAVQENASVSIEYAKSARSSCRGCSVSIAKGSLRFGVPVHDLRGFDSTKWYHVTCFPTLSHPLGPIEKVKGFDSIKDDDRDELRELEKDNKRDEAAVGPLEVPRPKKANAVISSPKVEVEEKTAVSPLEVPSQKKAKAHRSSPEVAVEDASVSVEYAKSARSSCRGCSVSIAKGSLRFGVPVRDRRGFDSTKWYHVTCFPTSLHPLGPIEKVKGFDSIKDDDREELRELEKDNKRDLATVSPLEVPSLKKANALIFAPKVDVAEKLSPGKKRISP
ncbi:polynucleotide 3'-phosphatase ZDP isoform X9 [Brachypodium distachyon]|uniref:polynucleotide 3'-phosphatase ZDP isoform X9 n=1 Tax=Brachypodium distachyon TaxID=15368 RepID=UPI000D0D74D5|nr:polynucleotide 3'-phosphatase ZDP isoform X9 [Brachypodium distachyon]|eukprot:XP_024314443.1 polynucleotide 3'-phosphatase ZDP isoform X9 [Brachypodium distachyon]